MKKFKYALAVVFMVTLFAGPASAETITGITLYGGEGGSAWSWNGQGWDTYNNYWWVLGVSSTPNGALVNHSDTTVSVPFNQDYWLYAEPTSLGSTPKVTVVTDIDTYETIFTLSGSAGTETTWSILAGSSRLGLGWAAGTADKVLGGQNMTPGGGNDFYLHLQAGTPVPLPGALWLMGAGLAGLAGITRRKRSNA